MTTTYTARTISEAYAFAAARHTAVESDAGDGKGGEPYLWHVLDVARRVRPLGPACEIVAVLHDTVEDTGTTLEEIEARFGREIRDGVDAMSKREGEDFFEDYMARVVMNPIAQVVKFSDSTDNLSRVGGIPDPVTRQKKEAKYRRVLSMLEDILPPETIGTIRTP